MKSKIKNIILLVSLITFALSTALYIYIYSSFSRLKGEVRDLYTKTAESKATYKELAKVRDNLKTTLGTEDRLASLFVNEDLIVDFIQVIENTMRIAEVSGAVDNVSESEDKDLAKSDKKELHVTLTVFGNFNEVLKFQGLLERLPFRTTIDSSTMLYVTSGENTGSWKETVNLTALVDTSEDVPAIVIDKQDEEI